MAIGNFVTNALNPTKPVNLAQVVSVVDNGLTVLFYTAGGGTIVWKFDTTQHATNAYTNVMTLVTTSAIAN